MRVFNTQRVPYERPLQNDLVSRYAVTEALLDRSDRQRLRHRASEEELRTRDDALHRLEPGEVAARRGERHEDIERDREFFTPGGRYPTRGYSRDLGRPRRAPRARS